ncbi:hypothetical protein AAG906_003251 [Vitis piasezkii]
MASNLAPWQAKKKSVIRPQVQETVIELDETFVVEQTEWCEIIEPIVPPIIEEVEEEEEMVANLQPKVHEWQQKRLSEAIEACANASSIPIPLSPPTPKAQNAKIIPFHGLGETVTISGDDSTPNVHSLSTALIGMPSWEELDVFLERFPTFTNMELPISHMNELFPIMKRVPMDMTVNPQQNFMARVLHETLSETIEAIMHLKDYSAM